jgi:hypothetical protein
MNHVAPASALNVHKHVLISMGSKDQVIATDYNSADLTDCTLAGIFGDYDVIVVDRGGTCEPIRFLTSIKMKREPVGRNKKILAGQLPRGKESF